MAIHGASSDTPMTDTRSIDALSPLSSDGQWQNAKVISITQQTARIKSFVLALSKPFAFSAGQHVDLRLTAPNGYYAIRSYSIASAPNASEHIELAIERLENGEVSPFFHEVVAIGDEIELRGPLGGHFIWSTSDGGPLLLAGGGSGVVPLMAMIRHRQSMGADVPTLLLFSARGWNDALFRDELVELDQRGDGFTLVLTLTREHPRRDGDYGRRVDAAMMSETLARLPATPKYAFICGSNVFVNAAGDAALAAGVPVTAIRTERYGG
jgi:ferredoxin-NADP reductase